MSEKVVSPARRVAALAAVGPDRPAIIYAPQGGGPERAVTWMDLAERSNAAAGLLRDRRVDDDSFVAVCAWNSPEHLIACLGAWTLGACVLPLSPRLPPRELAEILALVRPTVTVTDLGGAPAPVAVAEIASAPPVLEPFPDVVPTPGKSIASGGSTGRPKVVVDPAPWGWAARRMNDLRALGGMREEQVQLVPGPLYHNTPFTWCTVGLLAGHTIVLMERFDAGLAVDLIERHGVQFAALVPTMMKRIADLTGIDGRDLSSIESIFHTASPCPPHVKRRWLELLGPEKVFEGYGSTEDIGGTAIRGDEWLRRPGSVGRPAGCDVRILDEALHEVPPREVGAIYLRPHGEEPSHRYVGSDPLPRTADGFATIGDLGWLDEGGYLFLADRRTDLVITGGANVYPAEVESALLEHPEVVDVAVIGLPDEDLGKTVHAVVQTRDPADPPTTEALDAFVRERLAGYKAPRSYELVADLPRTEAGKIRRTALAEERAGSGRRDRSPGAPEPVREGPR